LNGRRKKQASEKFPSEPAEIRGWYMTESLKAHAPNHRSRLGFREFIAVDVDATFFDLSEIWLD
jgi:hypothetical protein